MNRVGLLGLSWLRLGVVPSRATGRRASRQPTLLVACPHCTNVDTSSRHCANPSCTWVRCTCGALVYGRRRHRHPRHGSSRDTCHDPGAAVEG